MTRVATIPMQHTLFASIEKTQQKLAQTQLQLSTGKKAADFSGLGDATVRDLSAHSMLARQQAQAAVSTRVDTTLTLYDANLTTIQTAATSLRDDLVTALGTGKAAGLMDSIQSAFQDYHSSLNAADGGKPLFAGSQNDSVPFTPSTLADLVGLPASSAFTNDNVKASARLADGTDVQYGITATDVGQGLYDAFQTLAATGTIDGDITAAQKTAIATAINSLNHGLTQLGSTMAGNGRRQTQVADLTTRATDRSNLLEKFVADDEDADLSQVAADVMQRKTALEASYSVFSQVAGLSLVKYLG